MFQRFTYLTLAVTSALFMSACEQSDPPERSLELVWSDEFNGTTLDLNKWEPQLGDGTDYGLWQWGNNEEQYYKAENATVENGLLKIKAVAEQVSGYEYTSARLRSLNLGDFKYGRLEASIRMDDTGGLWHAFWMLPSNAEDPWPISGEIDIMEYVGNEPELIYNTIHLADQFGNHRVVGQTTPVQNDNNFHMYAVEWDENQITWYRDSVETYNVKRTNTQVSATWPFDAEFHLLLNTAVGGNLGGNVNGPALAVPRFMEVDYVRVYQFQE